MCPHQSCPFASHASRVQDPFQRYISVPLPLCHQQRTYQQKRDHDAQFQETVCWMRDSSNRSRSASRFGSLVATTRAVSTAALSRSSWRGSHSSGRPGSVCPWSIVPVRSMRPALLRALRLSRAVTRDFVVAGVRSLAISGSTTPS